jgi:hypothetical protein
VLSKLDLEKAYDHVNWGIFAIFVKEMWLWKEMVRVDNSLYLYGMSWF